MSFVFPFLNDFEKSGQVGIYFVSEGVELCSGLKTVFRTFRIFRNFRTCAVLGRPLY
jgi:hypothetical protein